MTFVVFIIFIVKYLQKSSNRLSLTTLLVPKPVLGPERGALAVGPVRGAVGPPAVLELDASRGRGSSCPETWSGSS